MPDELPSLVIFNEILVQEMHFPFLRQARFRLKIDGRRHQGIFGAWAFWIPALTCKFFHSRSGRIHCIHRSAPSRRHILAGKLPIDEVDAGGNYVWGEWQRAYSKSAALRVAENYVAAARLHSAGLGPKPHGLCLAGRQIIGGEIDEAGAVGIVIEDVTRFPTKPPATEAQMLAAGVRPDKIKSCLRQQLNGYVVDLNSVVGAMPLEAEKEVATIEGYILEAFTAMRGGRIRTG